MDENNESRNIMGDGWMGRYDNWSANINVPRIYRALAMGFTFVTMLLGAGLFIIGLFAAIWFLLTWPFFWIAGVGASFIMYCIMTYVEYANKRDMEAVERMNDAD